MNEFDPPQTPIPAIEPVGGRKRPLWASVVSVLSFVWGIFLDVNFALIIYVNWNHLVRGFRFPATRTNREIMWNNREVAVLIDGVCSIIAGRLFWKNRKRWALANLVIGFVVLWLTFLFTEHLSPY